MLQLDLLDINALAPAAIIEVPCFEVLYKYLRPPTLISIAPGYEIPGVIRDQTRSSGSLYAVQYYRGKHQWISPARLSTCCWRYIYLASMKYGIHLTFLEAHLHKYHPQIQPLEEY